MNAACLGKVGIAQVAMAFPVRLQTICREGKGAVSCADEGFRVNDVLLKDSSAAVREVGEQFDTEAAVLVFDTRSQCHPCAEGDLEESLEVDLLDEDVFARGASAIGRLHQEVGHECAGEGGYAPDEMAGKPGHRVRVEDAIGGAPDFCEFGSDRRCEADPPKADGLGVVGQHDDASVKWLAREEGSKERTSFSGREHARAAAFEERGVVVAAGHACALPAEPSDGAPARAVRPLVEGVCKRVQGSVSSGVVGLAVVADGTGNRGDEMELGPGYAGVPGAGCVQVAQAAEFGRQRAPPVRECAGRQALGDLKTRAVQHKIEATTVQRGGFTHCRIDGGGVRHICLDIIDATEAGQCLERGSEFTRGGKGGVLGAQLRHAHPRPLCQSAAVESRFVCSEASIVHAGDFGLQEVGILPADHNRRAAITFHQGREHDGADAAPAAGCENHGGAIEPCFLILNGDGVQRSETKDVSGAICTDDHVNICRRASRYGQLRFECPGGGGSVPVLDGDAANESIRSFTGKRFEEAGEQSCGGMQFPIAPAAYCQGYDSELLVPDAIEGFAAGRKGGFGEALGIFVQKNAVHGCGGKVCDDDERFA